MTPSHFFDLKILIQSSISFVSLNGDVTGKTHR